MRNAWADVRASVLEKILKQPSSDAEVHHSAARIGSMWKKSNVLVAMRKEAHKRLHEKKA